MWSDVMKTSGRSTRKTVPELHGQSILPAAPKRRFISGAGSLNLVWKALSEIASDVPLSIGWRASCHWQVVEPSLFTIALTTFLPYLALQPAKACCRVGRAHHWQVVEPSLFTIALTT